MSHECLAYFLKYIHQLYYRTICFPAKIYIHWSNNLFNPHQETIFSDHTSTINLDIIYIPRIILLPQVRHIFIATFFIQNILYRSM